MGQVIDLAAYRRKRVAGGGEVSAPTLAADRGNELLGAVTGDGRALTALYDETVWQNWILITILHQCVQLSFKLAMPEPRIAALRRAGILAETETLRLGVCIARFFRTNKPLPQRERLYFLRVSRRLERRLASFPRDDQAGPS